MCACLPLLHACGSCVQLCVAGCGRGFLVPCPWEEWSGGPLGVQAGWVMDMGSGCVTHGCVGTYPPPGCCLLPHTQHSTACVWCGGPAGVTRRLWPKAQLWRILCTSVHRQLVGGSLSLNSREPAGPTSLACWCGGIFNFPLEGCRGVRGFRSGHCGAM